MSTTAAYSVKCGCVYDNEMAVNNALSLRPCQISQKREIEKNRYLEIDAKTGELEQERFTLAALEQGNASKSAIDAQRDLVYSLENDIEQINKKYDDQFTALLDKMQRNKLKEINRLTERDVKRNENKKNVTKPDVNLRIFGVREDCVE